MIEICSLLNKTFVKIDGEPRLPSFEEIKCVALKRAIYMRLSEIIIYNLNNIIIIIIIIYNLNILPEVIIYNLTVFILQ